MATTFFEGIAIGNRSPLAALQRAVEYITDPEKTDGGSLVFSTGCEALTAGEEMYLVQQEAEYATGRSVKQNRGGKSYCAMWMRQSFAPGEVTPELAHTIGKQLAEKILGDKYQYVVATHIDTHCIHNHILFNVIGSDQKKYHQNKYTPAMVAEISDQLCREHGLSVVEEPQKGSRGAKHPGKNEPGFRDTLRQDIDRIVQQSGSWEDFLDRMGETYHVFKRGQQYSFRHRSNGQQRNIRLSSLGYGYTEAELEKRIAFYSHGRNKPEIFRGSPHSYSAKLRDIKSIFAAVDAMEQNRVSTLAEYTLRLAELGKEETETLAQMKQERIAGHAQSEPILQRRIDEIREERKELLRMRAVIEKHRPTQEKGDDGLDR